MKTKHVLLLLIGLFFLLVMVATCGIGPIGAASGEELLGEFIASSCGNIVTVTNNDSVHPNTTVKFRSEAGTMSIGDVESEPGKKSQGTIPSSWSGLTVSVFVIPGPDGKHSLSWNDVGVDCPSTPTPSPTTVATETPSSTPTLPPATLTPSPSPTATLTASPSPTGTWEPTKTPPPVQTVTETPPPGETPTEPPPPAVTATPSPTPTGVPAEVSAPRTGGQSDVGFRYLAIAAVFITLVVVGSTLFFRRWGGRKKQ